MDSNITYKKQESITIPNNLMFEWEDRKSNYLARGRHVWTKHNILLIILQPFEILRKLRNKAYTTMLVR